MAHRLSNKIHLRTTLHNIRLLRQYTGGCVTSFPLIHTNYDTTSENAQSNKIRNTDIVQSAIVKREQILNKVQMVPNNVESKRQRKLSAYERMSLLMDTDCQPLILSLTAGDGMEYGDVNSAGFLIAIVKIMGQYCVINANDWLVKGGTVFPISLKKQLRAQEISEINRLPTIYFVDSGGAFLPLQVTS